MSGSQVDLSWAPSQDNAAIAGYNVYRDMVLRSSVSVTSFLDGGLSVNSHYCYAVSAYDAAGNESSPASTVCIDTPDMLVGRLLHGEATHSAD